MNYSVKGTLSYPSFLVAALTTLSVIVAVAADESTTSFYNGRSVEEWFAGARGPERINTFRQLGTNSFPFLIQKLSGTMMERVRACNLVAQAFEGAQIDNSEIKLSLRTLLQSRQQCEQIEAYAVIRRLGLTVPDSEIAAAAATCPSVKASEKEFVSGPKLARLHRMTNSVDCRFVAQLCGDPDPDVQVLALAFLALRRDTNEDHTLCSQEIVPALVMVLRTNTDISVLRAALAYSSSTKMRMQENATAVSRFLESTGDSDLQMDCLALFAALTRYAPLPAEARQSILTISSREGTDQRVRQFAKDLSGSPRIR